MKYRKNCEHSRHRSVAYTFKLNAGLVRGLKKLSDFYLKGAKFARLKDLDLTNSEYSNFPKLRYWGFAYSNGHGWCPTSRGIKFLDDKIAAFDIVGMMDDEILPSTHEAWDTHTKPMKPVYASDIIDFQYKQKEEYQEEKGSMRKTLFDN